MRLLAYGDRAVMVDLDDQDDPTPTALRAALIDWPGSAIDELVPAARTLLVRFEPSRIDAARIAAMISAATTDLITNGTSAGVARDKPTAVIRLPVRYDGPDLDAVAEAAGCSMAEVIARHTAAEYLVAFCGFAPGFAYLSGLDPRLRMPRLNTPRAAVPAGSVAIAGDYSAAYPRASPGGWQLIGVTDAPLWDVNRPAPALLTPGARVRFEATR